MFLSYIKSWATTLWIYCKNQCCIYHFEEYIAKALERNLSETSENISKHKLGPKKLRNISNPKNLEKNQQYREKLKTMMKRNAWDEIPFFYLGLVDTIWYMCIVPK
jgi:GTP1/Obg family GTP-binding protein